MSSPPARREHGRRRQLRRHFLILGFLRTTRSLLACLLQGPQRGGPLHQSLQHVGARSRQARRDIERDGLLSLGDMGFLDEEGYLFVCDRAADMVISGGVNIYPAEIEAALAMMPGVRDCAVFGIPDEEFGEALAVAVQLEPGFIMEESAVRGFLAERLAGYKVPRVVAFHDDLPREESGKIFKRRLRAPYWEKAGRRI